MQLLGQNYFAKKLQSQTVIREKMGKTLLYKKGASKLYKQLLSPKNYGAILYANT